MDTTSAESKTPPKVMDSDHDAEVGDLPLKSSQSNAADVMESSALLLLWSVLVINEGAIRFIGSFPSQLSRGGEMFSPYLIFFGGLAEVIFGLVGVFVAYAAFVPRFYSTEMTKLAVFIQSVLGYFVFIIFVFANPAVIATNLTEGLLGLSLSQSRFLITMGIFTSFHFCLALQGGQFIFLARLISAATGDDFLRQKSGMRMRALFWNGNLGMAGLWTIITGVIIRVQVGAGKLPMPYVFPPNVGTLPSVTIITGIVMLTWGIIGMGMGMMNSAPPIYFMFTGLVYVITLLNYGIFQFGFFQGSEVGGPIAMHNGLVFMLVFLGPYFVHKNAKEQESNM